MSVVTKDYIGSARINFLLSFPGGRMLSVDDFYSSAAVALPLVEKIDKSDVCGAVKNIKDMKTKVITDHHPGYRVPASRESHKAHEVFRCVHTELIAT